jgi:hypothetical protein
MSTLFDSTTLSAMRDTRRAFDPEERANPGKVIPVHACREWSSRVTALPPVPGIAEVAG